MEIPINQLPPGDPRLVDAIVSQLKSKGIFDKFRKECLADVDTKPAFLNLRQRVDGQVKKFLDTKTWRSDLNKNQLRDGVRKNIQESGILDTGIDAIINQVVNPKIKPLILPLVEDTVYSFLQVDKPKREIQEFEFQAQLAIQGGGKTYYEHQTPVPPPPLPPYSLYQEYPPPPNFYGDERFEEHSKIPHEKELKPNVAEDSSISSESPLSTEVRNEHREAPPVQEPQSTASEILPMETDAISSGEDDILGRTFPDIGSPFKDKVEEEFKMEEDNAVDSFDSARKEAEAVTSAVKKMSLGRDENFKSLSGSQERRETSASLPIFDNKSLDSISSNSSGLSLSTSPSKSATGLQESQSQSQSQMQRPESTNKSVDGLRSTQSTPLVDEKSLNESISSENSKSWVPYTLPKEMPSEERITIASFSAFGGEPGRFIEGASPVSADDSQSSLEKDDISKESIKSSKTDERSEGELTNTDSNSSIASPEASKDRATGSTVVSSPVGKDDTEKMPHPKSEESFKSVPEGSKEKEKLKSKDRDRHRRSKHDDHYSHHEKEKHHRRDKDDDKDKDKHGKGHHHHSGSSSRVSTSEGGSKEKRERSHDKSSDYKSHTHSKSHHSRSHSSRSHSKSHYSSNSESSRSKHSDNNNHHKSSHNKDNHKSSYGDKNQKSSSLSSDRGSEKSSNNSEKNIKEKELSKSQNERENKLSEKVSNKNSSVSSHTKVKKSDSAKIKPVKLIEDDMFALHLTNSNKNAVLPKPSNSVTGVKKGQNSKVGDPLKSPSSVLKDSNIKDDDKKKTTNIGETVVGSLSDTKDFKDGKPTDKIENLNNSKNIKNEKDEIINKVSTDKTNKEEVKDLKPSKENLKITIKKDRNDTLKVIKNKSKSDEKITKKNSPLRVNSKFSAKTPVVSPKGKLHVNGSKVSLNNKLKKRKLVSSSDSSTSSESESESSDSGASNHRRKSLQIRKKITRKSSYDSDSSSNSSGDSDTDSDKENKTSIIDVDVTDAMMTPNDSSDSTKLKSVTIPLVSLNSEDIKSFKHSPLSKNTSKNLIKKEILSDSDTLKEIFGSSSDDDSGIEFEGFTSNSETSRSGPSSVKTFKKVIQKPPERSKIQKYTSPKPFRTKSKKVKSQEYVVLCDSSDSSDMEVSLIKFCEKPYFQAKNKCSPKSHDFEGFDGENFEDTSSTADQKLKDYLAKFSFGSSIQLNDFLSLDSEEEIGEESTVFFTKKDTSKSVIEEIAAKQTQNEITAKQNLEEITAQQTLVELTAKQSLEEMSPKHIIDELFPKQIEEMSPKHTIDELFPKQIEEMSPKQTIEEMSLKQTIEDIIAKQIIEQNNITEDKSTPAAVSVSTEQLSDDNKNNDSEVNSISVFSADSSKPFKKRKLSSIAVDEVTSPTHSPKALKTEENKTIASNPSNKDIILNTYSLLTPEEDRTSSRDYEVDLGQRGTSYSPLSPASDSSSEVREALNSKNNAQNEATPEKLFCKATSSSTSS